ncbi:MAG TPA: hypothetical protein VFU21_06905 [Kofleriaceae bacterium]|nr:hypothetical protein [Kofleriaceae bacterium]
MEESQFEEERFFAAIAASGARSLLIGRRAMIALGLPVMTRDYDFWVAADDAEAFNRAVAPLGLAPNRPPDEARKVGRYVLENDEHVDVLVARVVHTVDGQPVAFDEVWTARRELEVAPNVLVAVPSLDHLIATKRFGGRARDADDIRMLEELRAIEGAR